MNIMTYKGLTARVEFDAEDEILVGRIAGINDVVGFHADDAKGIAAAFHEAVDDYIATCKAVGKEPEKTYSGKMMLRISPELHRSLALSAELAGKSLNQLCEDALGALSRLNIHTRIGSFSRREIEWGEERSLVREYMDILASLRDEDDEVVLDDPSPAPPRSRRRTVSDLI